MIIVVSLTNNDQMTSPEEHTYIKKKGWKRKGK